VGLTGDLMFYKLFINYLRLKLVRGIFNRIAGSRLGKGKNLKSMTLWSFAFELALAHFLKTKKKTK
jgi:hypothetical protein